MNVQKRKNSSYVIIGIPSFLSSGGLSPSEVWRVGRLLCVPDFPWGQYSTHLSWLAIWYLFFMVHSFYCHLVISTDAAGSSSGIFPALVGKEPDWRSSGDSARLNRSGSWLFLDSEVYSPIWFGWFRHGSGDRLSKWGGLFFVPENSLRGQEAFKCHCAMKNRLNTQKRKYGHSSLFLVFRKSCRLFLGADMSDSRPRFPSSRIDTVNSIK